MNSDPGLIHQLKGLKDIIFDLDFVTKSNQVAAACNDNSVWVWALENPNNIRAYKFCGHSAPVTGVKFNPAGTLIASCSRDKTVRLWVNNVEGRSSDFKAHTSAVRSVDFSPDGKRIATASEDKSIKIWTVPQHKFVNSFVGHESWVRCAKFAPEEEIIATVSDDRTNRLFDLRSGKEIHAFKESKGFATHLDFHPSGNCIGVGTSDKKVKVYDLRMQRLQQVYSSHTGPVSQVSFHPNGNYLVSSSQDGSIKMFDLLEARPIYDVIGHKESVTTVKFSTKGDYFASGSEDKMVYVWKTNFDEVDEQLGIGGSSSSRKEAKFKYSIETPGDDNEVDENVENQTSPPMPAEQHVLTEKSKNKTTTNEPQISSASELAKLNSKMDMIMKTLVLMDKRLTLVEDQLRKQDESG